MAKAPLRVRIAKRILGVQAKDFVPPLSPIDGWGGFSGGRLKDYRDRYEQLAANLNWCYTANKAIVDPAASVQLKIYRIKKDGEREEATDAAALAVLDLLANPNNMHSGEQLAQLHYTYMNYIGEGYTLMLKAGSPFTPTPGQLPDSLQELPAQQCYFKLADSGRYSDSIVKFGNKEYPVTSFIRDINPDPANPINGQSLISASASILNSDQAMREWNNSLVANGANPSLVFKTDEPLSDESYARWQEQFRDEQTGPENAGKPMLIEGGDVSTISMTPKDLDFLKSRQFTRDEILAMWRVSPYIIGSVEDVNLATARAARVQHAEINIEPRVRQWVRQMNVTFVKVFDATLELGYEDIVPEDEDAKLAYHEAAVNKWETIDEARAAYGEDELPDELGSQLYLQNTMEPISLVAAGPPPAEDSPEDADRAETDDGQGTNDPDADGATKSLAGVKKKI